MCVCLIKLMSTELEQQQKDIFLFLFNRSNCIKYEAIRVLCVEI